MFLVNVFGFWTIKQNSADTDKMSQDEASDQCLHCMLSEISTKIKLVKIYMNPDQEGQVYLS